MNNDLKKYFDGMFARQKKIRKILANILVWPLFAIVIIWTAYDYFSATSVNPDHYRVQGNYDSGHYIEGEVDKAKFEEAVQAEKGRVLTRGIILLFFPVMFGGLVFGMSAFMNKKIKAIVSGIEEKKIVSVYPTQVQATLGGKNVGKAAKQLTITTENKKEYIIWVADDDFQIVYDGLREIRSQYKG